MAARKKLSFEQGMEELEALVSALEKGEMTLDQSFSAYEKGVALLEELRAQLKAGEGRVMALIGQGEAPLKEEMP